MNRATDHGPPDPAHPRSVPVPPGHYRPRPPGYRRAPGPPRPHPGTPTHRTAPPPDDRRTWPVGSPPDAGRGESPSVRRLRGRLVALARVLAGGLVVLAVVVLGAPLVLGGPGPGTDTVVAHVVAAVVAVAATAVAAHHRSPTPVALVAGLAVPVTLLVLLWASWWA